MAEAVKERRFKGQTKSRSKSEKEKGKNKQASTKSTFDPNDTIGGATDKDTESQNDKTKVEEESKHLANNMASTSSRVTECQDAEISTEVPLQIDKDKLSAVSDLVQDASNNSKQNIPDVNVGVTSTNATMICATDAAAETELSISKTNNEFTEMPVSNLTNEETKQSLNNLTLISEQNYSVVNVISPGLADASKDVPSSGLDDFNNAQSKPISTEQNVSDVAKNTVDKSHAKSVTNTNCGTVAVTAQSTVKETRPNLYPNLMEITQLDTDSLVSKDVHSGTNDLRERKEKGSNMPSEAETLHTLSETSLNDNVTEQSVSVQDEPKIVLGTHTATYAVAIDNQLQNLVVKTLQVETSLDTNSSKIASAQHDFVQSEESEPTGVCVLDAEIDLDTNLQLTEGSGNLALVHDVAISNVVLDSHVSLTKTLDKLNITEQTSISVDGQTRSEIVDGGVDSKNILPKQDVHAHAQNEEMGIKQSREVVGEARQVLQTREDAEHDMVVRDVSQIKQQREDASHAKQTKDVSDVIQIEQPRENAGPAEHSQVVSDVSQIDELREDVRPAEHSQVVSDVSQIDEPREDVRPAEHAQVVSDISQIEQPRENAGPTEDVRPAEDVRPDEHVQIVKDVSQIQLPREVVSHHEPTKVAIEKGQQLRPMTVQELQRHYYNPLLIQNPAYIDHFITTEEKKPNHEFYEIILNYLRSRKELLSSEEDLRSLKIKYNQLQEEMWIITTHTITAQGQCGDKVKVSKNHVYEKCEQNTDCLRNMKTTLESIQNTTVHKISLFAYSAQLSRLQVESYLHSLFTIFPEHMFQSNTVYPNVEKKYEHDIMVSKLKDCISVLFSFHRQPVQDKEFKQNIRKWTETLVAALLKLATFEDHRFILNHILRSPGGVCHWACQFVQLPLLLTSTERSLNNLILDHIVVCLATVLMPVRAREEFLCQMKIVADSDTWTLIDSDGEEDEDPHNAWLYLHENDIIAILNQFPLSAVFSYILMMRTNRLGSLQYDITHTNTDGMLKIFAFSTCLIDILRHGLHTYSTNRYKQLNKWIGKKIRETVSLVSDHWENYKTLLLKPGLTMDSLQTEFDQFFIRATHCILTSHRLGSWQFLTEMPFKCVSSDTMWKLFWIFHHDQVNDLNLDSIPDVERCKDYLKDVDSKIQLVDNLLHLQPSDTIYLLTTFANMAIYRPPTEEEFIQSIVLEVFERAYVCEQTRELCCKVGRELLVVILDKHPHMFSTLLQSIKLNIKQIGMTSIYLLRELPLHTVKPADPDLLVLRQWLLHFNLDSAENQSSQLILSNLNWNIDQECGLHLPIKIHRQVALLLVESYQKHISNRNSSWLVAEGIKQMASVVRQNLTNEQKFNNWSWEVALKLKLHIHSIASECSQSVQDFRACSLEEDPWLSPVADGIKQKTSIASYLGLLMSSKTHNVSEFISEGLDILQSLVDGNQFIAVIHVLSCICPYFLSNPSHIIDNDRFIKIVQCTVWADETLFKMAKSVIKYDFPGTVTNQFTSMLQNESSRQRDMCNSVILFWVQAITKISKWYTDRNCCYVSDKLIQIGFVHNCLPQIVQLITRSFKLYVKESNQQGMVSSVVSWISSGVYMYQPILSDKLSTYVWLAYIVLLVEKNYELETKIWPTLQEELHISQLATIDQALRVTLSKLKLQKAPAPDKLNIYCWSQLALNTAHDHPLLPIIWQQFFLLYLGRSASERSVSTRASVGERFFSSLSYSTMLKKMRKRLTEIVQIINNQIQDEENKDNIYSENQLVLALKLTELYKTMILWLEEPRLHDTNLYLPSLPPQYDSTKLLLLFQNIQAPWLEFVNTNECCEAIINEGKIWTNLLFKLHRSSSDNQLTQTATERIIKYIRKDNILAPPSFIAIPTPVPETSTNILEDKEALLHLINSDINVMKQHAHVFSSQSDRHCGIDIRYYVDLLPSLYSNQWKQVMLTVECKSKVNPLHKCSNPAVVQVRIEEKEMNGMIQRQIDENRAEYQQLTIEELLPPPLNICVAAVHVENTITKLINLTQATSDESKIRRLFDIGSMLFYHLTSVITTETEFYPPTKQFFSSCIEILGQEFISRDPRETGHLLQVCLDNPTLSGLTCPHFKPNNNMGVFVSLYEQLIQALQQQNMDLVFMLLTKFDVWQWLDEGNPPKDNVKRFLSVLGSALMACGAEPENQSKLVFDLYCSHLQYVLQYNYPVTLMDVLNVLLQGSSIERLHVQCWEMLLTMCFSIKSNSTENVKMSFVNYNIEEVESCRDVELSLLVVNKILVSLSRYFQDARSGLNDCSSYGLYPAWGRYVPYISQLLGGFIRGFVTKLLIDLHNTDPYQVLGTIWQQVIAVFSPWIQPNEYINRLLSPWHEGDELIAREMVCMFKKIVIFIFNEYTEKAPVYSISVYSLLLMYFITSLSKSDLIKSVATTFTTEFKDLNWKILKPDLQLLETMATFKDNCPEPCFNLIVHIISEINWTDIWDHHVKNSSPDIASRFQSTFLILLIQAYNTSLQLQKQELDQLLQEMETRDWDFLTLSSYRQACNVFLMSTDPKNILAQRSSFAARGLGLMKNGGCFAGNKLGAWSGDRLAKRQMYMHTVSSLLCQCTYLEDVNHETFSTILVNLLSDLESVEETVVEGQEEECAELLKTLLSLLNNSNPLGSWKALIITTLTTWIKSSPNSILLVPCIKAASKNLASYTQMAVVIESCIDVIFHPDSSYKDWTPILAAFEMPANNEQRFLNEAVSQGSCLVLQMFLLQKIPFCQSLVEEFRLMDSIISWTEKVKPGLEDECKLLLWWRKLFQLLIYYIDRHGNIPESIKLLYRLIAVLQTLGEDRTTSGLFGAIGLGRKSQLSLRFRITSRVLAAFISCQIISPNELKLSEQIKHSTTPMTKQTLTAAESLKSNKLYAEYHNQCEIFLVLVKDESSSFRQIVLFLSQIISAFFSDKPYLQEAILQ